MVHPDGTSEICIGGDWMRLTSDMKANSGPITTQLVGHLNDLDASEIHEAIADPHKTVILQVIDTTMHLSSRESETTIDEELGRG